MEESTQISREQLKSALESMLFVWGEPLEAKAAAKVFDMSTQEICTCFREIQQKYENAAGGLRIREIDKKFQFYTPAENDAFIEKLCTPAKEKRLSQAALEVLAIIAYKQPVTKGEIERIRGIKCDRVMEGLIKRRLVDEAGRGTGVGRPVLYCTTSIFLEKFGIRNLDELPVIEDIADIIGITDIMDINEKEKGSTEIEITDAVPEDSVRTS